MKASVVSLFSSSKETPPRLRMSRELRKAVKDLKRYAWEEEKRMRDKPQSPSIFNAWSV
jgi:hypothetical protein